jgi:hypothetical protein
MRQYTLLFLFILCSCGTRKKALDVTTTKSEFSTQKESQNNVEKDIKEVVISDISISEVKSDVNTTFEGKVSDSTKPASIEESVKDGVKTTVFNNFKEIKTSDSKAGQTKHVKETKSESLTDNTIFNQSNSESSKSKTDNENKVLRVERKSSNSWVFWLILALCVVGGGYYLYKKKSNPLNWF